MTIKEKMICNFDYFRDTDQYRYVILQRAGTMKLAYYDGRDFWTTPTDYSAVSWIFCK